MKSDAIDQRADELASFLKRDRSKIRAELDLELRDPGVHVRKAWKDANPRTEKQITDFYRRTNAYLFDLAAEHSKPIREQMRKAIALAMQRAGAHSVLDYGGGAGYDLEYLAKLGFECTYYDLPGLLSRFASWRFRRMGLNVRVCTSLSKLGRYDCIVSFEVLEHLPDPLGTLKRLYRMLNNGGLMVVTHAFDLVSEAYPSHIKGNRKLAVRFEAQCREIGFNPITSVNMLQDKQLYVLGKNPSNDLMASLRVGVTPASDPMSTLLSVYYSRDDLQSVFKDVSTGEYHRLITWAAQPPHGDPAKVVLQPYEEWFTTNLRKIDEAMRLHEERSRLQSELTRRDEERSRLQSELTRRDEALEVAKATVSHLEEHLEEQKNSVGWKFITKYRELLNRYTPLGTRRRRFWEWVFRHVYGVTVAAHSSHVDGITIERRKEDTPFDRWVTSARELISTSPRRVAPQRLISVDIIIPVHNGLDFLSGCLRSIKEHTEQPYRVVVIDDASNDPRVVEYLSKLEGEEYVIVTNSKNLGFVESINKGLSFSRSDVVILNSDTIVTHGWLDKLYRCAYSSDAVGTVTPLSNNATICSVPEFCQKNELPPHFGVDSYAELIEIASQKEYPPIPTAIGFCTYIKRIVIDKVGDFDNVTFSPGYGEENDLCMRAFKAGFLSVLDDSTYIYHHGEASFSIKSAQLKDSHLQTLYRRYPEYPAIVADFVEKNPLAAVHVRIRRAMLACREFTERRILYVMHLPPQSQISGGTGKHCRLLYEHLKDSVSYVVYPQGDHLVLHEVEDDTTKEYESGKQRERLIADQATERAFERILAEVKPCVVHFQHLLGMPMSLVRVAKDQGVKVVITLHDGYFMCPDWRLLEMGETYCDGCTDLNRCDGCLNHRYDLNPGFQEMWRRNSRAMLELADRIVVPSEYQLGLCARVMDLQKERFTVIEHGVPGEPVSVQHSFEVEERFKVGFVGAISDKAKGRDVVLRLLDGSEDGQFEWHFFGEGSDIRGSLRDKSMASKGLVQFYGYYREGELPTILQKTRIDVVVIPSIYAESYSYVLTEVWKAGVPVIAADFGAIGERVRRFGGGWLYRPGSEPESIRRILARIREDSKLYQAKAKEAIAVQHRDFNEFVDQYRKMHLVLVGGSGENVQTSDFLRYFRLSKPRLG